MRPETPSKQMGGVSELTVVMDVKPGLVDMRETTSYATRLGIVLRTLFEIRRRALEERREPFPAGPLEDLAFLHFVRFSMFDEGRKLLLAVTFDGTWEPYIRSIAEGAGPILDVILCNCERYAGRSSDKGHVKFADFVREHQVTSQFFFADSPGVSAEDVRYLTSLEARLRDPREPQSPRQIHANHRLPYPSQPAKISGQSACDALMALYNLRAYYPDPTGNAANSEHLFLHQAAQLILEGADFGTVDPGSPVEDARRWLDPDRPSRPPRPPVNPRPLTPADEKNVQGNILDHYDGMTHGCLLLMRIAHREAACTFLNGLSVTTFGSDDTHDKVKLNVGLTYEGLGALGRPEQELETLPREFREGMEARAGWLGDLWQNHPRHWKLPEMNWPLAVGEKRPPVALSTVDLVIQLQTKLDSFVPDDHLWSNKHPLHPHVEQLMLKSAGCLELLAVEPLRRKLPAGVQNNGQTVEHFGFVDGLSQPTHNPGGPARDHVALGELLLGYPNDRGDSGAVSAAFDQGSFLVIRKLRQDVQAFTEFKTRLGTDGVERMVGRKASGEPIVDPSRAPTDNDFDFEGPGGAQCPLHAHIRRANPRVPQTWTPRILRRGFSYGLRYEEDPRATDRGLFFMAYNASIADQFERIQRWVSGGNSTGGLSAHADPLVGLARPGQRRTLLIPDANGTPTPYDLGDRPFVRLEWGLYLFVPSVSGLKRLTEQLRLSPATGPAADKHLIGVGNKIIENLEIRLVAEQQRMDPAKAREVLAIEWKKLLEDEAARDKAKAVWAAIRQRGGVLSTPYGTLVGSAAEVMGVFSDPSTFSVRAYWERMDQSLGAHYLGMDPQPRQIDAAAPPSAQALDADYRSYVGPTRYATESADANVWIRAIGTQPAFEVARRVADAYFQKLAGTPPRVIELPLIQLISDLFGLVSTYWFELPDGGLMKSGTDDPQAVADARCPQDFFSVARYVFSPNPTPFVQAEAIHRGTKLRNATLAYVEAARSRAPLERGTLVEWLLPTSSDNDLIARVLAGAVHGFVGPVGGSWRSILEQWLESQELWRQQHALLAQRRTIVDPFARALGALGAPIVSTLQRRPFPYLLHRVALDATRIGGVPVPAGEKVVLGLVSATQDQPGRTEILFGGSYAPSSTLRPVHACPGEDMAMGTLLGLTSALLEAGTIERQTRAQFALTLF